MATCHCHKETPYVPIHLCTENPCPVEDAELAKRLMIAATNYAEKSNSPDSMPTPKSPEEIIEEWKQIVLKIEKGETPEWAPMLRESMASVILWAAEEAKPRCERLYGESFTLSIEQTMVVDQYKNSLTQLAANISRLSGEGKEEV